MTALKAHEVARFLARPDLNEGIFLAYGPDAGLVRAAGLASAAPAARVGALQEGVERLIQLIAPMMPHLAETCWQALGKTGLVTDAAWPEVDPALLVDDTVTMPVQVNGKRRGEITVAKGTPAAEVERLVLSMDEIVRILAGQAPKKIVIVPDRIVNVVV